MDIIVLLKRVPDAGARLSIEGGGLEIGSDAWILNPYDEFAVEEALRIRERHGGRVTLMHAGCSGGEDILKKGIAMGADSALYIKDPALKGISGVSSARVLAAAIKGASFDIILCGKQGTDTESGVVGPSAAGILDIPFISSVKRLAIFPEEKKAEALREAGGARERVECALPALFCADKGLNEPRYPSLHGIMRAKREEIRYLDLKSIDMSVEEILKGAPRRLSLSYPQAKRKGVMLKGDVKEQAKEAARLISMEVKSF